MSLLAAPIDRVDGVAKVTGRATYAADTPASRLAHAVLVQSTIAKGSVASIDRARALTLPGVVAVLTPFDAPALNRQKPKSPQRVLSVLQDAQVHYNGQPIAVVVAATLEQARAAANALDVRYEQQKSGVDFLRGKPGAIKPEKANQHETDLAWGDFDAALRTAEARIDATYITPSQFHNPLEPHATLAQWEGDALTVHDATQGVFGCRETLAFHFDIAPEKVRVVSPFVGGGFGGKGSTWSHVVLCAMAAKVAQRPVKLVLDRPQMFGPVGGRPRTEQHVVLAATREGVLTGVRHDVITQSSMLENWVEPSAAQTRMLYASPAGTTTHRLVKLDLATPTYQRAPGEASGTFALEVAMDELARQLDLDPVELRLRNYAEKEPASGKPFSEKSLLRCYEHGARAFGWSQRARKPGTVRDGRWRIGLGMATATYPANRSKASALARLLADGTALVQAGTQDIGTGTYTVMTQVAAEELSLPIERVRFELGDTTMPETPVSGGSQTAASVSTAVQAACKALRQRLLDLATSAPAGVLAGAPVERLALRDGWVVVTDEPARRESFAAILAHHGGAAIEARAETPPADDLKKTYALHSFGAAFAEVGVDAELGIVRLRRLHGTYDVGRRLNEKLAHSQLVGGIVWAASFALFEDAMLDAATGRYVNANLAEYHVPVNADIGDISVGFIDSEEPHLDPLGIRGIGEIGITGMAAAIANAIYDATGKRVRSLPIRLDDLLG